MDRHHGDPKEAGAENGAQRPRSGVGSSHRRRGSSRGGRWSRTTDQVRPAGIEAETRQHRKAVADQHPSRSSGVASCRHRSFGSAARGRFGQGPRPINLPVVGRSLKTSGPQVMSRGRICRGRQGAVTSADRVPGMNVGRDARLFVLPGSRTPMQFADLSGPRRSAERTSPGSSKGGRSARPAAHLGRGAGSTGSTEHQRRRRRAVVAAIFGYRATTSRRFGPTFHPRRKGTDKGLTVAERRVRPRRRTRPSLKQVACRCREAVRRARRMQVNQAQIDSSARVGEAHPRRRRAGDRFRRAAPAIADKHSARGWRRRFAAGARRAEGDGVAQTAGRRARRPSERPRRNGAARRMAVTAPVPRARGARALAAIAPEGPPRPTDEKRAARVRRSRVKTARSPATRFKRRRPGRRGRPANDRGPRQNRRARQAEPRRMGDDELRGERVTSHGTGRRPSHDASCSTSLATLQRKNSAGEARAVETSANGPGGDTQLDRPDPSIAATGRCSPRTGRARVRPGIRAGHSGVPVPGPTRSVFTSVPHGRPAVDKVDRPKGRGGRRSPATSWDGEHTSLSDRSQASRRRTARLVKKVGMRGVPHRGSPRRH